MTDAQLISRVVMDYGAFALLAWLIWHVTRVTLPRMQDQFSKELQQQREEAGKERAAHTTTVALMASTFEKEQQAAREDLRRLYEAAMRRIGSRHEGRELEGETTTP